MNLSYHNLHQRRHSVEGTHNGSGQPDQNFDQLRLNNHFTLLDYCTSQQKLNEFVLFRTRVLCMLFDRCAYLKQLSIIHVVLQLPWLAQYSQSATLWCVFTHSTIHRGKVQLVKNKELSAELLSGGSRA